MDERILIVADAESNVWMRNSLAPRGFLVTIADNAKQGYEQLRESQFDLVIVNVADATEGLNLIKRIRTNPEMQRVAVLSIAEWGTGQATMALTKGADGFERRPLDSERLLAAVRKLLQPNLTMIAWASGVDGEVN